MAANRRLLIGRWTLDPDARLLRGPGGPVPLSPKAFAVLSHLADRPGEVISREEFRERVWHETYLRAETLARVVSDLRKALGDDAVRPRYIETVPRRGFRLRAVVRPVRLPGRSRNMALVGAAIVLAALIGDRLFAPPVNSVFTLHDARVIGSGTLPVLRADGALVAFAAADGAVVVQSTSPAQPSPVARYRDGAGRTVVPLGFDREQRLAMLALGTDGCEILAWPYRTAAGATSLARDCLPTAVTYGAYSPRDRGWIYTGMTDADDRGLRVAATDRPSRRLAGSMPMNLPVAPRVAPDGNAIAVRSGPAGDAVWILSSEIAQPVEISLPRQPRPDYDWLDNHTLLVCGAGVASWIRVRQAVVREFQSVCPRQLSTAPAAARVAYVEGTPASEIHVFDLPAGTWLPSDAFAGVARDMLPQLDHQKGSEATLWFFSLRTGQWALYRRDLKTLATREVLRLPLGHEPVAPVAVRRDRLAIASRQTLLITDHSGRQLERRALPDGRVFATRWSPWRDGDVLVTSLTADGYRLWRLRAGEGAVALATDVMQMDQDPGKRALIVRRAFDRRLYGMTSERDMAPLAELSSLTLFWSMTADGCSAIAFGRQITMTNECGDRSPDIVPSAPLAGRVASALRSASGDYLAVSTEQTLDPRVVVADYQWR